MALEPFELYQSDQCSDDVLAVAEWQETIVEAYR
jgi:hypothetical protein